MTLDPRKLPDLPELMIAGPGELHEEDLAVLSHQVIAHYGDLWAELMQQTLELVSQVLGAAALPYVIPGTSSACLDAAVMNLFEPGERVVVADTGFFGTRMMEIARAQRLEVVEVPVEVGSPIDPERIADAAAGAAGVLTVQVETATGVRHPIEEIARVAHEAGALYLVDGVASVGGELCEVDAMGLDALVTGSQKGLDSPPGLGLIGLSTRGRERIEARSEPPASWYLDLKRWDWYRSKWAWHPHPVTMPSNLVLALCSSLRRILDVGVESWVEARRALAERCRRGLCDLGLEPIPEAGCGANLVVAMWADDPASILQRVLAAENIMISGGLAPTAGKAIRVGLMGRTATEAMVDRVVTAIGAALRSA